MHKPVLLQEVIDLLKPEVGETMVDCTVNRGGHAKEIGARLGSGGLLIGLDRDEGALSEAKTNLATLPCRVLLEKSNFRRIGAVLDKEGVDKVDGVLFDLGLSSDQLDLSGRGFSFQRDEPLEMTFEADVTEATFTAYDIVNTWDEENIADIIYAYGEETFSRRIAHLIVEVRKNEPIKTTKQLVEIIAQAVPGWYRHRKTHFATKTFQALRMAVNEELQSLDEGLLAAWERLNKGGRLVVISFHSLEARLVKNYFRDRVASGEALFLTKKAIGPSREEELANPRSRSAQVRGIRRL